jgi:XisH protein
MSRKDRFHELVKQALIQTGWTITDDPLYLGIVNVNIQIDLAAEPLMAATKNDQKIAVEVKTFGRVSQITDFYSSLGQYLTYQVALKLQEPERELYLAVPKITYDTLFQEILIQEIFRLYPINIIVYSQTTQEIESWID